MPSKKSANIKGNSPGRKTGKLGGCQKQSSVQLEFPLGGLHASPGLQGQEISQAVINTIFNDRNVPDPQPEARLESAISTCVVCGQKALLFLPDKDGIKIVEKVRYWVCESCTPTPPKS